MTEESSSGSISILELAEVIRSKNCGPYELTFDVVFRDTESYAAAVRSGIFDKDLFARLYGIPVEEVLGIVHFPQARAIKATIVRPVVSGDVGETDVYGAQQHAPLLTIMVPVGELDGDRGLSEDRECQATLL
jgi:hypothetical protein